MNEMKDLLALFQNHGKKLDLPVNGRISLNLQQNKTIWLMEQGTCHFFWAIKKEEKLSAWSYLASFIPPALLFGFEAVSGSTQHELFIVCNEKSLFWELDLSLFSSLLEKERKENFVFLLRQWISALSFRLSLAKETLSLDQKSLFLAEGEAVSAKKHSFCWIEVVKGALEFFGKKDLRLTPQDGPFPLNDLLWFTSEGRTEIIPIEETSLIEKGLWVKGLLHFHLFFFEQLISVEKKENHDAFLQWKEKGSREERSLEDAISEMIELLNPPPPFSPITSADLLFKACQSLGKEFHLSFQLPPKGIKSTSIGQQIDEIAMASGIRYRQITLLSKWWESATSHLIGFYGPEQKPVALVFRGSGHYAMIDPSAAKEKRVDAQVAEQLHKVAYTFYHALPEEVTSGRGIIHYYVNLYKKEFYPLIFYSVLSSVLAILPSFATGYLFYSAIPQSELSLLMQVIIGLFLAAFSTCIFFLFRSLLLTRIEGLMSHGIQAAFWDRLLRLPVSFFRKYSSGNLILRVMSIKEIQFLLMGQTPRVVLSGFFSLFYIFAMAFFSFKLTLIAMGLSGLGFLTTYFFSRVKKRIEMKKYQLKLQLNSLVIQIASGVAKLRISGAELPAFSHWATLFARYKKLYFQSQKLNDAIAAMNAILPNLSLFAFFLLLTQMPMSASAFFGFYAAFAPFIFALCDISNTWMNLIPIFPIWGNTKVLVEEKPETLTGKDKPGVLKGTISVDEVSFSYQSEKTPILQDVSFYADPGEFIAIVGPSGSGKSTLIQLLLGFEKPFSGAIYYDGKDLQSLDIHAVREQLGVVLQEGGLLAGSIYENLSCGKDYTEEEIQRALELSCFQKDLSTFSMGLYTFVPPGGETFSGGQRQRLLIARALLRKPRILLFDEATSGMESTTQEEIMNNLKELKITRIAIAHRLTTVRKADRIYVLNKGKIIQSGSFEELAKSPGLFATFLAHQKL